MAARRRTGIAQALLSKVFERLSERGVEFLIAEADLENDASTTLLRSLGAERVGGYVELSLPRR